MLGVGLVVGVAMSVLFAGTNTSPDADGVSLDPGVLCWLAEFRTVVDCDTSHDWELAGSTDSFMNLASFTPYFTSRDLWFAIYIDDCSRVATAAMAPDRDLSQTLAIVGVPLSVPTLEEWEAGDRIVTCGAGIERAVDGEQVARSVEVAAVAGVGSLRAGTWRPQGR